MSPEKWILICAWIMSACILLFVPRNKIRIAWAAFLFMQVITWVTGLIVVEKGWLEYPVRSLASITRTSLDYEFFIFPSICAIFNARYPVQRSKLYQFGYYATYCSVLTLSEVIFEKYTKLIKYIHWDWYVTWITLLCTFFITRMFVLWLFGKPYLEPNRDI